MANVILILGGARSGKSTYAEQRAAHYAQVHCLVTAWAGDAEMQARIARHQADRPAHWVTVETGRELAAAITEQAATQRCLLVDCLTLWLCRCLHDDDGVPCPDTSLARHKEELAQALRHAEGTVILIANELGLGIVPLGEVNRRFVDEAGWLNQAMARLADEVWLVTAGLPMRLK